jgi:peptidyl-dipeptidase A
MRTVLLLAAVLVVGCGSKKEPAKDQPIVGSGSGSGTGAGTGTGSGTATARPTLAEARAWIEQANAQLKEVNTKSALADWDRQTNITATTKAEAAKTNEVTMATLTRLIRESRKFDPILPELDADSRRMIELMRTGGSPGPDDPAHATELATVTTEMDSLYGEGKACDPVKKEGAKPKNCKDLDTLSNTLAESRKPDEMLKAWTGWHAVGKTIKPHYVRFVELANEAARDIGFADVGTQWRSRYDMPPDAMVAEADRLWGQVKPLYDQLHCYVRRTLSKKYGEKQFPSTGPMPAHLLGNMWAQDWSNIYELVEPFPGQPSPDVTKALKQQKYDAVRMTRLAEGFFTSLGMQPLPDSFWKVSMFTRPKGKEVMCHASAWNPKYDDDVRIKMCIEVNQEDLVTLHHELGHDYYYLNYFKKPFLYQDGANDGFHEAIGDTIALSITPTYLNKVGLLDKIAVDPKAVIDRQMFVALEKVAFLPWSLLVDKWRWEVFAGKVTPDRYNDRWWELRQQYQGVVAPVARTADDFDPGAKYHVPGNTPYLRYFLARILQFQFHRALCKTAGHTGPLHECTIYGNKDAGARLAATLALGSSKPWPDALEALTGERTMDASAILEYFAPLQAYLAEQNAGQTCGW